MISMTLGRGSALYITDRIGLPNQNHFSRELYEKLKVRTTLDLAAGQNPQEMTCHKMGIRQLLIDSFYSEPFEVNIQRVQIDFMDY